MKFITEQTVMTVAMVICVTIIGWYALPSIVTTGQMIWGMNNMSKAFLGLMILVVIADYVDRKNKGT